MPAGKFPPKKSKAQRASLHNVTRSIVLDEEWVPNLGEELQEEEEELIDEKLFASPAPGPKRKKKKAKIAPMFRTPRNSKNLQSYLDKGNVI